MCAVIAEEANKALLYAVEAQYEEGMYRSRAFMNFPDPLYAPPNGILYQYGVLYQELTLVPGQHRAWAHAHAGACTWGMQWVWGPARAYRAQAIASLPWWAEPVDSLVPSYR